MFIFSYSEAVTGLSALAGAENAISSGRNMAKAMRLMGRRLSRGYMDASFTRMKCTPGRPQPLAEELRRRAARRRRRRSRVRRADCMWRTAASQVRSGAVIVHSESTWGESTFAPLSRRV